MRLFISVQMARARKLVAQKTRYFEEQHWDRCTASQSQSKVALMWRGGPVPPGLGGRRVTFCRRPPPPLWARGGRGGIFLGRQTPPKFCVGAEILYFYRVKPRRLRE